MKADQFKAGWRRVLNAEDQKLVKLSLPPWEKEKESASERD